MSVMSDEPLAMPFDSKMRWIEADDVDSVSDSEDTAETLILDGGDDEVTKQYREYANKCAAEEKARYEAYKAKKEAEEKTRLAQAAPSQKVMPILSVRK